MACICNFVLLCPANSLLWGHPYTPMSVCHLHICMPPYLPFTPVCLPILYVTKCHGDFGGHLYTPYVLGSLGEASVHLSGISKSISTPIASPFITVIAVAPHQCGLLLYWTGCLWMSAMLHAVVPIFVVFSSYLKLLLPQLQLLLL